jgi:hypothetical protein
MQCGTCSGLEQKDNTNRKTGQIPRKFVINSNKLMQFPSFDTYALEIQNINNGNK